MASSLPKDIPIDRETVMKEVTRGYELTTQLQSLLQQTQRQQGDRGSELLVLIEGVMQSQTKSLSILNSVAADKDGGSPELGSGSSIVQGIEQSGEKVMLSARHRNQRHRGKKSHLQPRTQITSAPHYDGHQWRKYGDKKILNSNYRRSYHRCTHKYRQSCPAIKQVQQIDSKDFLVTYIDNHTCHNTTTTTTIPQQLSVDPTSPSTELQPFSITFGSNTKSALLIGHMDNWQPATWPSSYHPAPPDQPTHGSQPLTTTTPQLSVDPNPPTTDVHPFSLTFGIPNTEPTLSGQMDSRQPAACPSSNHPVPPDQPTHESMGVDQELLSFTLDEVGGGGDVVDIFSSPLMSPITNYYNELESLLNS